MACVVSLDSSSNTHQGEKCNDAYIDNHPQRFHKESEDALIEKEVCYEFIIKYNEVTRVRNFTVDGDDIYIVFSDGCIVRKSLVDYKTKWIANRGLSQRVASKLLICGNYLFGEDAWDCLVIQDKRDGAFVRKIRIPSIITMCVWDGMVLVSSVDTIGLIAPIKIKGEEGPKPYAELRNWRYDPEEFAQFSIGESYIWNGEIYTILSGNLYHCWSECHCLYPALFDAFSDGPSVIAYEPFYRDRELQKDKVMWVVVVGEDIILYSKSNTLRKLNKNRELVLNVELAKEMWPLWGSGVLPCVADEFILGYHTNGFMQLMGFHGLPTLELEHPHDSRGPMILLDKKYVIKTSFHPVEGFYLEVWYLTKLWSPKNHSVKGEEERKRVKELMILNRKTWGVPLDVVYIIIRMVLAANAMEEKSWFKREDTSPKDRSKRSKTPDTNIIYM